MKNLIIFLLTLSFALQTFAQQSVGTIVSGTSFQGQRYTRNFIKNPDAEKSSTFGVHAAGGALSIDSTTPIENKKSFLYTSITGGAQLQFAFDKFEPYMLGQQCSVDFRYRSATADDFTAFVTIEGVQVSGTYTFSSTTDVLHAQGSELQFPCGTDADDEVLLVIQHENIDTSDITIDMVQGGLVVATGSGTAGSETVQSITADGTGTHLDVDSPTTTVILGNSGQVEEIDLPDATTLEVGKFYYVYNMSDIQQSVYLNDQATGARDLLVNDWVKFTLIDNSTSNGDWAISKVALELGSNPNVQGVLGTVNGGLGADLTPTGGELLYGGSGAYAKLAAGTTGYLLKSNGTSAPSWLSPSATATAILPSTSGHSGEYLTNNGSGSFSWAAAGLATQAIQEGSSTSTTLLKVPSNQLTNIGTGTRFLETGNSNLLGDPGFERTSGSSPWSAVTWTGAPATINTTAANNHGDSLQSMKIDVTADYSIAFLRQDVTLKGSYAGQLIEHGMWFKTTNLNLMQICARQNGARVGVCFPYLNLTGDWEYQYATSVATSSTTSLGIELAGTGNMTGTGYADDAYVGPLKFDHSPGVSDSNWYVDATMDGANPALSTSAVSTYTEITNGSLTLQPQVGSQPVGVMCSSTNAATAPSTGNTTCAAGNESVGINFTIPKMGPYEVCVYTSYTGIVNNGTVTPTFEIIETPTNAQTLTLEGGTRQQVGTSSAGSSDEASAISNCSIFNWTSSGIKGVRLMYEQAVAGTVSSSIILADAGTSNGQRNIRWIVKPVSNASFSVQSTNVMRAPTITTLTSGSGTYSTPLGVARLEIEMIGGGGGGGGGGSGSPTTGGTGGNTTFGTSLLTANGAVGPAGGTATIGTGAAGVALTGVNGQGTAIYTSGSGLYPFGGMGASTPFGGGGPGGEANGTGVAAITNTGAGGGGGSTNGTANVYSGKGGGAGGYIKAQIDNPAASYSYAVGAGGTAGSAGTNGLAGGAGGSGVIRIKEIYGVNVPPMKAGVIAADNPGGVTTINTVVAKTSNYTGSTSDETVELTGGNTFTLPAISSFKGKRYVIRQSDSSGQVTINTTGSDKVCNQTSIKLTGKPDEISLQPNAAGTDWTSTGCVVTRSANISCLASGSGVNSEGTWVTTGNNTTGVCVLTMPSGIWSNIYSFNGNIPTSSNGTMYVCTGGVNSNTSISIVGMQQNAGSTSYMTTFGCFVTVRGAR